MMRNSIGLCLILFGVLVAAPAIAQSSGPMVTLTAAAPVFAAPNESQTPLRVGKEGSVLRLLDLGGDWCQVEFDDPQYGRRTGYVQTKYVRMTGGAGPVHSSIAESAGQPSVIRRPAEAPSAARPVVGQGMYPSVETSIGWSLL